MLFKLIFLISAAAIAMLWWQGSQVHELAIKSAKKTCERCGVQFLDHTVAKKSWKLRRGSNGHWMLERQYRFEFSPDGDSRYKGQVHAVANRITAVILEPYPEV